MPGWARDLWSLIVTNEGAINAVVGVLTIVGTVFSAMWGYRKVKATLAIGQGGHGGNARVGGNGTSIGGRGGKGGSGGNGGRGGSAEVTGDGIAIGGDGGDAGVSWRPALGAPSAVERKIELGQQLRSGYPIELHQQLWSSYPRDEFGFIIIGSGGHGGDLSAQVVAKGYVYPLLPLVRLLRLWAPAVLNAADDAKPGNPQEFWDIVTRLNPQVAGMAEDHTRYCLETAIPNGLPSPDPYEIKRIFG